MIETPTGHVWLRDDGIIQTTNRDTREQTLEDARANVAAISRLLGAKKRPLYVDSSTPAAMTVECQNYYVSDEAAKNGTAVALVANSWFGRFVGNLMLARRRQDVPVRLFENGLLVAIDATVCVGAQPL